MQARVTNDLGRKEELCLPASPLELLALGHCKSGQQEVDKRSEASGRHPGLGQQEASDNRE